MSNTHGEWLDKIRGHNKKERKTVRLIDADALKPDADYDDGEFWAYSKRQIEAAPTIEPERKKGKWEYGVICSICGERCDYHLSGDTWIDELANFCPNCGADMRGEADG